MKLGQMLALRYDLLPAAYCDELFGLLNQVAPFPYDEVREIIRRSSAPSRRWSSSRSARSRSPPRRSARSTEPCSATASTSRSRSSGRASAQTLQADIHLMYAMTWLLDWTHLFGGTGSRDVIDEFARWTADEVDYLVEARQAVLLHEHAKDDRYERIARVYRDYTTSRVLTTELIEGIPLIEIMIARRDGDDAYLDALAAAGHDLDRIVRQLDWNMLNQVFVFGYFHADLHPANLFVLRGRRHRLRGLRDRRPAAQPGPGVAHPLQLAALPGRGRGRRPRAHALARADRGDRRRRGSTGGSSASTRRSCTTRSPSTRAGRPEAPGPALRPTENPYSKLAVDILETVRDARLSTSRRASSATSRCSSRSGRSATSWRSSTTCRRTSATSSAASRASRRSRCSTRGGRSTACTPASGRIQRALDFVDFLEGQEPMILEAEASLFGFRHKMQSAGGR